MLSRKFPASHKNPFRACRRRGIGCGASSLSGLARRAKAARRQAFRCQDILMATTVTAALLVIGDEILSGRTKDKNIGYIAEYLSNIGVDLREGRVGPDAEEEIVAALNALRRRYTYVFTTGGIGPTHDDITADCVA